MPPCFLRETDASLETVALGKLSKQFNSSQNTHDPTVSPAAMLLPRILAPMRALSQNSLVVGKSPSHVYDALRFANGCSAASTTLSFVRHATHQAQGRANGAKDGPGKRLGAKKAGGRLL